MEHRSKSLTEIYGELLAHYAGKAPHKFVQYDVFCQAEADSMVQPDPDGDWTCCSETYELMSGGPTVRVLILPGTPVNDVRRALKKISKWIKRDGLHSDEKMRRRMSALSAGIVNVEEPPF
jgi:hypothetical protein